MSVSEPAPLKVVFMGTPAFSVPTLQALAATPGVTVVGVVTAVDKPAGRGQQVRMSAVKEAALALGLPILQPVSLKDPIFQQALAALRADLFVIVAFRMLPEAVWRMPRLGSLNLHASLLPAYRGAAPINWVLINGEAQTGCTTFLLKHEIDTGDLLHQVPVPLTPDTTAGELHDTLMQLGAPLVVRTVQELAQGTARPQPQQFAPDQPMAPKLMPELGRIDWAQPAVRIHNLVRGLSPVPAAYTTLDGLQIKLLRTRLSTADRTVLPPGTVQADAQQTLVACADGWLEIVELQMEGRKRMPAPDFFRGWQKKIPLLV